MDERLTRRSDGLGVEAEVLEDAARDGGLLDEGDHASAAQRRLRTRRGPREGVVTGRAGRRGV